MIVTTLFTDIFGRKLVFCLSNIGLFAANIALPWVQNYYVIMFLRYLNGLSGIVSYVSGFILVIEMVKPSKRMIVGCVISWIYMSGAYILDLIAYFARDWHDLVLYTSAPIGLNLLSWFKLFGLSVDEHRNLSVDQFELGKDQTGSYILFKGRANKTYKGGLNQRNLSAKNLKHYLQNPVLFKIYEQYLNIVRDLNGTVFYRRPLDKGSIKFGEQSVGVNKLSNIMKTMCAEAGIEGYFTNHSGKRTCATTLYQTGVPEQDFMNRTCHTSVESVRKYKRASNEMLKDISNIPEPSENICKKIKHENSTENREPSNSAGGGVGSLFTGCVFNFNSGS
ncbi:unnamed protein product [Mytilus coruscus]|nr:unnamed protein product [Mytilus coruscus]